MSFDYSHVIDIIYEGKYDEVRTILTRSSDNGFEKKLVEAIFAYELGKYDQVEKIINNILKKEDKIKDIRFKIRVYIQAAYINWRTNKLQSASIKVLNAQKMVSNATQLTDKERLLFETKLAHIESIISWSAGNLETAIELNQENYKKFLSLSNDRLASLCLNNLGVLYTETGKFAQGLITFEKTFNLNKKRYIADYARSKNNLSALYRDLGEYTNSIKQAEEALEIQNQLGNPYEISSTLLSLVLLYSQVKLSGKMISYHTHLSSISGDVDSIIHVRKEISAIVVLKENFRLRDKYEALLRLETLCGRTDIRSDLLVVSLKFFCELLFFDWKLTGNEEIVLEIEDVLNRLYYIAQYQKSILLESEVLFLRSQVLILQNNFEEAKIQLKLALDGTQKNGFHNMAIRISNAYDHLLQKEEEFNASTPDYSKVMPQDSSNFGDYFERYALSPHFKPIIEHERPVMFLILKQLDGTLIYAHHFILEEQINEHLLSSFISAVNSFASSTFKTGALDRIKSGDFTLLINSTNNLLFVYIFNGYSYYGIPKLEYLVNKLAELEVLNEMKQKYMITNNERDTLETEVMKVFSTQYETI